MFPTCITFHLCPPFPFCIAHVCGTFHFFTMNKFQSFLAVQTCIVRLKRITMANNINSFMDNMRLNTLNSINHLLKASDKDKLNIIQHSPYMSDEELIQSRIHIKNGLSILSSIKLSKSPCKV